MWGGLKSRRDYKDVFKRWSATRGLDELREALFREPRPWFLAFSLHQQNHLLQDHHISRLTSWCTSVVQLKPTREGKVEAYRYSQEMFGLLATVHKPGKASLQEYFRLCAVGKDLTSAFQWHKYWIDSHLAGLDSLTSYTWLLRIAELSPSQEMAEDMVLAVRDSYIDLFCNVQEVESKGEKEVNVTRFEHFQPTNDKERAELQELCAAFSSFRHRVQDASLVEFLKDLPVDEEGMKGHPGTEWPGNSFCHNFPQLEQNVTRSIDFSPSYPLLKDSILHDHFIASLEMAAFKERSVSQVLELLKQYQEMVKEEREKPTGFHLKEGNLWRQFSDATARKFRQPIVQGGGLTAELYHYVISALCLSNQPTAALRTLQRMRDSNIRLLDCTRFVCMVAASESQKECSALFNEQMKEIRFRQELDSSYDTCKEIEHYWKYQYTDFLYYRNRLDEDDFYFLSLQHFGVKQTMELLAASSEAADTPTAEWVAIDFHFRKAAQRHFEKNVQTEQDVQHSLDDITHHLPLLDVSLIGGDIPGFREYCLTERDQIYTDLYSLKQFLELYDEIFLVDASFVEVNDHFSSLGSSHSSSPKKSLVLYPFVTLTELAATVAESSKHGDFCMDTEILKMVEQASDVATSRLLSIFTTVTAAPTPEGQQCHHRVLHFTECLLSYLVPLRVPEALPQQEGAAALDPSNRRMLDLLTMIRLLGRKECTVSLCCDDPNLLAAVHHWEKHIAVSGNVVVLSTSTPQEMEDFSHGLINDNPVFDLEEEFEPKLDVAKAPLVSSPNDGATMERTEAEMNERVSSTEEVTDTSPTSTETSPWLEMLNDQEEEVVLEEESAPIPSSSSTVSLEEVPEEGGNTIDLMNLYESPHDVIPIGQRMEEASALGDVFGEFDVYSPEEMELQEASEAARRSNLSPDGGPTRKRRPSLLEKESRRNRGASGKERYQAARAMSNMTGGRIPFNLRYNVVEANVNHPQNKHLKKMYEEGLQKKRSIYKKTHSKR